MILPIRTDCPLRSPPYVNYGLIFANILVFALQKLGEAGVVAFDFMSLSLHPGSPELLTFVTYAFLHGGWLHLISNMVFLFIFGNNVCDRLGQMQYLAFYLGGAVFAGIGFVLLASPYLTPDGLEAYAPVVGASGAVAAVTGAYLVLLPRSRVTVFYFMIIIGVAEIPALWFVAFFFLMDVILGLFGADSNVAHSAHIAGTVFGVSVLLTLLKLKLLVRDQFDLLALLSRWHRRRQFRTAVSEGWDPYGTDAEATEGRRARRGSGPPPLPSPQSTRIMEMRAEVAEAMAHRNLARAAELYLALRQVDPGQVMSRNAQLDIANQLAEMSRYAEAAEAYELYLRHYPDSEQFAHIELLTGILYSRYLGDPARALARIEHALPRLTSPRDVELATAERARLRASVPGNA